MKKFLGLLLIMLMFAACDNAQYTEYGGEITAVSGEELVSMSVSQAEAERQKLEEEEEIEQLIEESEAELSRITIADRIGGTVEVPEPAGETLRIVSCSPAISEILSGLGLMGEIIAADTNSADVFGVAPEICTLDMMNLNTQYIADLEPDIVIIGEISEQFGDPISELEDMGIYTAYIPAANSIEGIKMDIEFLAGLTGMQNAGGELISAINTDLLYIEELVGGLTPKNVFFEVSGTPEIYAVAEDNFLADMIKRAGGQTVLTDKSGFVPLTADEVLSLSGVDVYITNVEDGNPDYIYVDTNLTSRPSQNFPAGIREIAKILHPEAFPDESTEEIPA
ncbi:MAG: ABC transporter substrate-binding protein [Ruminococcus sp.]|nr:ABC transporter substrate-binding protein [Ruminococcus sp.]